MIDSDPCRRRSAFTNFSRLRLREGDSFMQEKEFKEDGVVFSGSLAPDIVTVATPEDVRARKIEQVGRLITQMIQGADLSDEQIDYGSKIARKLNEAA